jgi:hypothetical protein
LTGIFTGFYPVIFGLGIKPLFLLSNFNQMKKIVFLSIAIAAFSSCTFKEITPARSYEIQNSKVISIAKIADYSADLTVKIEGSSKGVLSKVKTLDYYKDQATVNACMTAKCDFLINPTFNITVNGGNATIIVSGYGAKYTTIRDVTAADSMHIKLNGGNLMVPNPGPFGLPKKQKKVY